MSLIYFSEHYLNPLYVMSVFVCPYADTASVFVKMRGNRGNRSLLEESYRTKDAAEFRLEEILKAFNTES